MSEMNKKGKVDWSKIDGSSPKPKRLHLKKTRQIACITVQYRCVNTRDLKVNVAAGNM